MTRNSASVAAKPGSAARAPEGTSRLLAGLGAGRTPLSLEAHLDTWGALPLPRGKDRGRFVEELAASGLRGRGGAWFPTAAKWRAVASGRRRPIVVVNASESEPASAKDATLLSRVPHLVIDGALVAASTLDATRVVFYLHESMAEHIAGELRHRRTRGLNPIDADIITAPQGYVAGEESAVVNFVNGGPARAPTFTRIAPVYRRGVAGGPTLVQNVETLAHAALIARFGADWFRSQGTSEAPGTTLVTLSGAIGNPRVLEVPLGTKLADAARRSGMPEGARVSGVLTGGYGGSWLDAPRALATPLTPEAMSSVGGVLGAGAFFLLTETACPVAQMAGLTRWMAQQSAGQCGPCVHGLASLGSGLEQLTAARAKRSLLDQIRQVCSLVEGRGACRHPDGVARMVRSGLSVFALDVDAHLRGRRCAGTTQLLLPTRTLARSDVTPTSSRGNGSMDNPRAAQR